MGDFDFGGGNFGDIEKVKNIKGRYDALIAKMFSTGYSKDMYDEYKEIKGELNGINPQIIQESGINLAILDMIEQKHQEEVKKLEALKQEIESFNNKYVNILETFILEHNENIKDEIKKYKTSYSKLADESKELVYNNEDVFKAIADSFVKKPEPKKDTNDLRADVSEGLDLTKEEDQEEYRNRLVIPFAKQIVDRVNIAIKNNQKLIDEDGRLVFTKDELPQFIFAEVKVPEQIKNGTVDASSILGSWEYDEINGMLIYTPKVSIQGKYKYVEDTSVSLTECALRYKLSFSIFLGDFTEKVISAANKTLKRNGVVIDYGACIIPERDITRWDWYTTDNENYDCTHSYELSCSHCAKKKEKYTVRDELKEKYDGYYSWDYFFTTEII